MGTPREVERDLNSHHSWHQLGSSNDRVLPPPVGGEATERRPSPRYQEVKATFRTEDGDAYEGKHSTLHQAGWLGTDAGWARVTGALMGRKICCSCG